MPLVRIDLRHGKPAEYRRAIGQVVYESLVSAVGAPVDDRFQVITEHSSDGMIFDPSYLGIQRSEDCIFIQITLNCGRTLEQKQRLYKAIADGLHQHVGLRQQDVFIGLVEASKENWSFGDGVAQKIPGDWAYRIPIGFGSDLLNANWSKCGCPQTGLSDPTSGGDAKHTAEILSRLAQTARRRPLEN